MPDFTMCIDNKCSKRKMCYRYLAIPNSYQSYANFKEKSCVNYIELNKDDQQYRSVSDVDKDVEELLIRLKEENNE